MDPIRLEDVKRLDVKPGEVLVVRSPMMTAEVAEHLTNWFREALPGVKVLILDPESTVEVVSG